jgi:hypothetical protein
MHKDGIKYQLYGSTMVPLLTMNAQQVGISPSIIRHITAELLPIAVIMPIIVTLLLMVMADTQRYLIGATRALLKMHKLTLKILGIGCQRCQLTLALRALPRTNTIFYLLFLRWVAWLLALRGHSCALSMVPPRTFFAGTVEGITCVQ